MVSAVVFLNQKGDGNGPQNRQIAMSRSLGALVPAAVAGLISDVIIAGPHGLELDIIADHAGCAYVEAACEADWLRRALALAKAPNCLVLRAGYVPGFGFIEELESLAGRDLAYAGLFRAEPRHWFERLFPSLAPIAGAIASQQNWQARRAQDFNLLSRSLKGRTLRTKMLRVG